MVCACSRLTMPRSGCLNQPPGVGSYAAEVTLVCKERTEAAGRMVIAVHSEVLHVPEFPNHAALEGASQLYIDF